MKKKKIEANLQSKSYSNLKILGIFEDPAAKLTSDRKDALSQSQEGDVSITSPKLTQLEVRTVEKLLHQRLENLIVLELILGQNKISFCFPQFLLCLILFLIYNTLSCSYLFCSTLKIK